jgi:hypothetical protein
MFSRKTLFAALSMILIPHGFLFAGSEPDVNDPAYFTIGDISTTVTVIDNDSPAEPELPPRTITKADPITAGAIVNAGLTAWGVINGAQPNGNFASNYANAMPNWVDWNTISGWKGPKELIYGVKIKNLYGIAVVDLKYMISYFYSGNSGNSGSTAACLVAAGCVGGAATCPSVAAKCDEAAARKGSYIANLKVKPLMINIRPAFKFDMDVSVSNPMNIGTAADPLAYLQIDLMWAYSSPFKKERGVWTYSVDGRGNFNDLTRKTQGINTLLPIPQRPESAPQVNWN